MSRSTKLTLLAVASSLALLGCNELVGIGDFHFGDTDAGGMDAGPRDAGPPRDGGEDAGTDAGPAPVRFTSLAAGERFSCAVRDDGEVLCWGLNKNAQLGRGAAEDTFEAVAAPVSLGLDPLSGATQVSAGRGHACAVASNGGSTGVYCWGLNDKDQVGNPEAGGPQLSAIEVTRDTEPLLNAEEVATGHSHACALLGTGEVYCWGRGGDGQIGNDGTADRNVVSQVVNSDASGPLTDAIALAAGATASCALPRGAPQAPLCWGEAIDCGSVSSRPRDLVNPFSSSPTRLEIGDNHACALVARGRIECVGVGAVGQLGDGTMTACTNMPVRVLGSGGAEIENATALAVGIVHACASTADGVVCWGDGAEGQLGNGMTIGSPTPVTVLGPGGGDPIGPAALLAAGYTHTCAVMREAGTNDRILCWGADYGATPVFVTLP